MFSVCFCRRNTGIRLKADAHTENWSEIFIRAGKVYLFVAGLVGLSWGLRPLVDIYIRQIAAGRVVLA